MQLNHHRIDHTTLYSGGGYIPEDDDILKSFATNFPSRVHYSYHHLITLKNLKNDININPRVINDTTNPPPSQL